MRLPEPFELALESDPEALLAAALEHAELQDAAHEEAGVGVESHPDAAPAPPGRRPWR